MSGALLQSYFRSGWAFLISYLAAYLLYAWLRWPVNPVSGGQWAVIPCLLHIYWLLHAIHFGLGAIALRSWWRSTYEEQEAGGAEYITGNRLLSTVYRLLPWIFLTLLFYIPGIYFEWPSDPWEHLRRINEWQVLNTVTAHSSWIKSSYFIPYSLLSWTTGLRQIFWLDFYYTGICLLLCWQYYRLARACDLGERVAMLFVLLQTLLLGNGIFSFYRYYGASSSIFAQIGAVALTRIALEALRPREMQGAANKEQGTQSILRSPSSVLHRFSRLPSLSSVGLAQDDPVSSLLQIAGAGICLLPLIAFNHAQGLGIAVLGVAAVFVWRLIEWRRSMFVWLVLAATLLSMSTVMWWPRQAALDEIHQAPGWLTAWYGFNLLSPASPSFARAAAIIGLFGLINLFASLLLLRRNQVIAWLSLFPTLMLCLPVVALPLANALVKSGQYDGLIVFHRLLLAIPAGLSTIGLVSAMLGKWQLQDVHRAKPNDTSQPAGLRRPGIRYSAPFVMLLTAMGALVSIPASGLSYNRLYNTLSIAPDDLVMRATMEMLPALQVVDQSRLPSDRKTCQLPSQTPVIAPRGMSYVLAVTGRLLVAEPVRLIGSEPWNVPATRSDHLLQLASTAFAKRSEIVIIQPRPFEMYTPHSFAGYLSQHWRPNEVAFEYAAAAELSSVATKARNNPAEPLLLPWKPAVTAPMPSK